MYRSIAMILVGAAMAPTGLRAAAAPAAPSGAAEAISAWLLPDAPRATREQFEREAIAPRLNGSFDDLLIACVKHPAFLEAWGNLDNYRAGFDPLAAPPQGAGFRIGFGIGVSGGGGGTHVGGGAGVSTGTSGAARGQGGATAPGSPVETDFATALLRVLTGTEQLDGTDVDATARAFTGWTTLDAAASRRAGHAVFTGRYRFLRDAHDTSSKSFRGAALKGEGEAEGRDLLRRLAGDAVVRARFVSAVDGGNTAAETSAWQGQDLKDLWAVLARPA